MAATTKVWLNNNPPTCEDDDLNGFKNENNNAIVGSGQALNTGDLQQTHKAMVVFSSVGNFYADSGAVNAYVLSAIAPRQAAPALINGMIVRFVAATPSTGAATINYNGTGALSAVRPGGVPLASGDIANEVSAQYDAANTRWVILGLQAESAIQTVGWVVHAPITVFTGNVFNVTGQETNPGSIVFNTDGTRMYVVGTTNSDVFEYSLSIGFDFSSTVAYTGNSFSVTAQDGLPRGLAFNSDGTRMFMVGDGSDIVYEYSLSVGFDLGSTVAYTGNNFVVSGQATGPVDLAFSTDGTRMYVLNGSNDTVYEYSLSVGFDLSSTVAYTGNSFVTTTQASAPQGVRFNTDGTRMLILDGVLDDVFAYSLSVGFDLSSTVTYLGESFNLSPQGTNLLGFTFSTNGSRMYAVDFSSNNIYEYFSNFVRAIV